MCAFLALIFSNLLEKKQNNHNKQILQSEVGNIRHGSFECFCCLFSFLSLFLASGTFISSTWALETLI